MRVAVLTLTRDRLPYTQHCFARLREFAGCDFDHYVLDQGSDDGSVRWLMSEARDERFAWLELESENVGIHCGMNELLTYVLAEGPYDVVVKFDNDCELVEPDTLKRCCDLALVLNAIVSPEIHGLGSVKFPCDYGAVINGYIGSLGTRSMVGGIFMAVPATVFTSGGFRFDESMPKWGGADAHLCSWFRARGGDVGYLVGLRANHFRTTVGQEAELPEYFARSIAEGAPA